MSIPLYSPSILNIFIWSFILILPSLIFFACFFIFLIFPSFRHPERGGGGRGNCELSPKKREKFRKQVQEVLVLDCCEHEVELDLFTENHATAHSSGEWMHQKLLKASIHQLKHPLKYWFLLLFKTLYFIVLLLQERSLMKSMIIAHKNVHWDTENWKNLNNCICMHI